MKIMFLSYSPRGKSRDHAERADPCRIHFSPEDVTEKIFT
jgi:hypothetical protein